MKIKILAKNILATMLLGMTSIAIAAEKPVLNVIVPSGNSGSTWAQSVLIRDGLIELGYDSEIIHTKNCVNTINWLKNNNGQPAFFLYSDNRYISDKNINCHIEATKETFIANFNLKLHTMCVRADENFTTIEDFLKNKDRVTVATTNTLPGSPYEDLSEQFEIPFVRVDYDGAKMTMAGLLSGDTDLLYQRYTALEATTKEAHCFTTSSSSPINGMTPMKKLFPNWELNEYGSYQYAHGVNMSEEQIKNAREVIFTIQRENKKLNNYITTSYMVGAEELHTLGKGRESFLENVNIIKSLLD